MYTFRLIDGEGVLSEKDYTLWKYVFSDLDLDAVLQRVSARCLNRPWMDKKTWFHRLSKYIHKLEKGEIVMSTDQDNFIITDPKWKSGIQLDEYNDQYSLVAAYESRDGKINQKWCYAQSKDKQTNEKKPSEKAMPWRLTLGTREEAIKVLTGFIEMLGGALPGPEVLDGQRIDGDNPEYQDLPF